MAGPVVAGVVAFDKNFFIRLPGWAKKVNDSKQLSPVMRAELQFHIKQSAASWSVGVVSPKVIDRINILAATKRAADHALRKIHMQLSVDTKKTFLLLDGNFLLPNYTGRQEAVVHGDALVFCIAAASIVAKVYRDELMVKLDKKFPGYEFKAHKGYGTKLHKVALKRLGLSSIHRKTFC